MALVACVALAVQKLGNPVNPIGGGPERGPERGPGELIPKLEWQEQPRNSLGYPGEEQPRNSGRTR